MKCVRLLSDMPVCCRSPFQCSGSHVRVLTARPGDLVAPGSWAKLPVRVPDGRCRVHALARSAEIWPELEAYPLPHALVTGRAAAIVWPPWRVGLLPRQSGGDRLLQGGHA